MYGIAFGFLIIASAFTTAAKAIEWLMELLRRKMR